MLKQKLNKPYFLNSSFAYHFKHAVLFGVFVFLFLFVFKPFSIDKIDKELWLACAGFGAVTFISMFFMNIIIPKFFEGFFDEESWTVGKEILYTILNICVIGLFNFVFFLVFFNINFSWSLLFWVQFITIAVAVFPVAFSISYKEKKNSLMYSENANLISENIPKKIQVAHAEIVKISSKNQNENLEIDLQKLLFLKSADNYIEVYFWDVLFQKKLIRNTLKDLENELENAGNFFRCHKSYMVNLDKVLKISGNAQGYKLHFKETDETVPVSRQYNSIIKNRLTVGQ